MYTVWSPPHQCPLHRALPQAHPQERVERWATDPHRLGLQPIMRRVWSPRGHHPGAVVLHRYHWGYLDAFVHPRSGHTVWLLLLTVAVPAFTIALAAFAQAIGAGARQHVLLGLDRVGWQRSPQVKGPAGLHLHFVPPDSPALQPAERLWPLTNEALANRNFRDVDALQEVQTQRCLTLHTRPEVIRACTQFHWWPHTA